jgi:CRISPR/Cas system-associated exonuclease Cas4 (RecB family)
MIYLNRDKKTKQLKPTDGLKSKVPNQKWRIYELNEKIKPFRLSRSKFSDYLNCKRCFYLEQVKGLKPLDTIPFTLNNAVDGLCKKEFDFHRDNQTPHPIMIKNNINAVPFKHENIEKWQDALSRGIDYVHPDLNLKLAGGIDDVWLNKDTNKLIMADYKAQSKSSERKIEGYLEDVYHEGYKLQLDFYRYLFEKNGFEVQTTGYFVVYNATLERQTFDNKLDFTVDLVAYETDTSHIEDKIIEMKKLMDGNKIPEITPHCQNCNYIIAGDRLINNR